MKLAFAALLLLGTLGVAQTPAKAPKHSAPAAPAAKVAPAVKPETKPAAAPAANGFFANKDSKVVHKADCKLAMKMKAENKVAFASKAEAEKAGYKACKICKP